MNPVDIKKTGLKLPVTSIMNKTAAIKQKGTGTPMTNKRIKMNKLAATVINQMSFSDKGAKICFFPKLSSKLSKSSVVK